MVLAVGPRASQEQNLGALSVAILTRQVESGVPRLGKEEEEREQTVILLLLLSPCASTEIFTV